MAVKRGYMYLALRGLETELREMADQDGIVMLSNRAISKKLQVASRTIDEMIQELMNQGVIYKTRGLVRLNGSLNDANGSLNDANDSFNDARHEEIKDSKILEKHESLKLLKENKKNTHAQPVAKPRRVAADDPGFKEFWAAYPRRVGKIKASSWWEKRWPNDEELMSILYGLDAWTDHWQERGTELQFIPHPATWLNAERWTEEPT